MLDCQRLVAEFLVHGSEVASRICELRCEFDRQLICGDSVAKFAQILRCHADVVVGRCIFSIDRFRGLIFAKCVVPGATVSAPLRWSEVTRNLDVARFTIRAMPRRLASMKDDPLLCVLTDSPDIRAGLEELAVEFHSASR